MRQMMSPDHVEGGIAFPRIELSLWWTKASTWRSALAVLPIPAHCPRAGGVGVNVNRPRRPERAVGAVMLCRHADKCCVGHNRRWICRCLGKSTAWFAG